MYRRIHLVKVRFAFSTQLQNGNAWNVLLNDTVFVYLESQVTPHTYASSLTSGGGLMLLGVNLNSGRDV